MESSEKGSSTPQQETRRPGELAFAIILCAFSAFLLWSAYGISHFEALSAPGTIPMISTFIMLVSAIVVANKTRTKTLLANESFKKEILPPIIIFFMVMVILYAILLKPLGFLPTSALFLIATIKVLSKRSWGFTISVSLFILILIWFVFRVVFTVLIPPGIVPESEMLQFFRNLTGGAK